MTRIGSPDGFGNSPIGLRAVGMSRYHSIMCSTAWRIAEIGRAIDEVAVKATSGSGDTDPIVARLAELWALLAELDPEVARRLAGYQALSTPTDLSRQLPRPEVVGSASVGPVPACRIDRRDHGLYPKSGVRPD